MAERGRHGPPGLVAALRREARAERPEFSATLHERVLAATQRARPAPAMPPPAMRRAALLGCLATATLGAAIMFGVVVPWPAPEASVREVDVVLIDPAVGIERLPTPGEIGAGVLAEVTTMAAAAVGVPLQTDFFAYDALGSMPDDL